MSGRKLVGLPECLTEELKLAAVVVNGPIVPIKPEMSPKIGTGERLPTPTAKDSDDYEHANVKNRGRVGVLV
jgi:hypothetical protein